MDKKPIQRSVVDTLIDDVVENPVKLAEWLQYMFENEAIAASIMDLCRLRHYPDQKMYQLVALGLMMQKNNKMVSEWCEAESAHTRDVSGSNP